MKITQITEAYKWKSNRAGVYPIYFDDEGKIHVKLFIPSDPKFGGSNMQMAKGGIDDGERSYDAALREGHEEIGLKRNNIKSMKLLTDTQMTGKNAHYKIYVFVAEVIDPYDFDPMGFEASWTGWVELNEAIAKGRANQQQFLQELKRQYSRGLDVTEDSELKNTVRAADLENRIKGLYQELKNLGTNEFPRRRIIQAEIQHLKSQLELSAEHGIEPVAQPDYEPDEDPTEEWLDAIRPMINEIKAHCKPWLDAIEYDVVHYPLYRGMRGTGDSPVVTGRIRLEGRSAMSTGDHVHEAVNDYFTRTFGEPFRNAMFASSDPDFATDYGNLYLVFPRGEFTFIWSPDVVDLYNIADNIDEAIDDDKESDPPGHAKFFETYMDDLGYRDSGVQAALDAKNEMMIRARAYYGIRLHSFFNRDDYIDDSTGNEKAIQKALRLLQQEFNR